MPFSPNDEPLNSQRDPYEQGYGPSEDSGDGMRGFRTTRRREPDYSPEAETIINTYETPNVTGGTNIGVVPGQNSTVINVDPQGPGSGLHADVLDNLEPGTSGQDYIPYADTHGNVLMGLADYSSIGPAYDDPLSGIYDATAANLLIGGGDVYLDTGDLITRAGGQFGKKWETVADPGSPYESDYVEGWTGRGITMRKTGPGGKADFLEVGNLSVRGTLLARELEIRKLTFSKGPFGVTVGGGKVGEVSTSVNTAQVPSKAGFSRRRITFGNSDPNSVDEQVEHGLTTDDFLLAQEFDPKAAQQGGTVVKQVRCEVAYIVDQYTVDVYVSDTYSLPEPGDDMIVVASADADRDSMLYLNPYGPYMDILDGLSNFSDWDNRAPITRLGNIGGISGANAPTGSHGIYTEMIRATDDVLIGDLSKNSDYVEFDVSAGALTINTSVFDLVTPTLSIESEGPIAGSSRISMTSTNTTYDPLIIDREKTSFAVLTQYFSDSRANLQETNTTLFTGIKENVDYSGNANFNSQGNFRHTFDLSFSGTSTASSLQIEFILGVKDNVGGRSRETLAGVSFTVTLTPDGSNNFSYTDSIDLNAANIKTPTIAYSYAVRGDTDLIDTINYQITNRNSYQYYPQTVVNEAGIFVKHTPTFTATVGEGGSSGGGGGGGSSPVSSVFGRTGAITANAGDYSASQITNFDSSARSAVEAGNIQQVQFANRERGDVDQDGALYFDSSVGMYVKATNAAGTQTGGRLLWSGANAVAGAGILFAYGSEDEPTIAVDSTVARTNVNETFDADLTISGNIAGFLTIADHLPLLNSGEQASTVSAGFSGFEIDRGAGTNYLFGFSEAEGDFAAGTSGYLSPVAFRTSSPTDGALTFWDQFAGEFDTATNMIVNSDNLTIGTSGTDEISLDPTNSRIQIKAENPYLDLYDNSASPDHLWRIIETGSSFYIRYSTDGVNFTDRMEMDTSGNVIFDTDDRLKSFGYSSGIFGSGWTIDDGASGGSFAEFDNMRIRNEFRTHIFKKDIVKASNGYLLITDSAEVETGTTFSSGVNDTIRLRADDAAATFSSGDLLWIKSIQNDGTISVNGVKLTVNSLQTSTANYNEYTVSVENGGTVYEGDTAVRVSGGYLMNDASSQYAPFLAVYDGVSTWGEFQSAGKEKLRLGNLAGAPALTNGTTPTGYGLRSENVYLEGEIIANSGRINELTIAGFIYLGNNIEAAKSNYPMVQGYGNVDDTPDAVNNPVPMVASRVHNQSFTPNRVEMFWASDSLWGIRGYDGSANKVFHLGSENVIAGWSFDDKNLSINTGTGTVELGKGMSFAGSRDGVGVTHTNGGNAFLGSSGAGGIGMYVSDGTTDNYVSVGDDYQRTGYGITIRANAQDVLYTDSSGAWINNLEVKDSVQVGGVSAKTLRQGGVATWSHGFENGLTDWNTSSNNSSSLSTDSYSGTYAALLSSTVDTGISSGGSTGGVQTSIPEEIALQFGGARIEVTVYAKKPSSGAASTFAMAYSTSDTGNSGWSTFSTTTSWKAYRFVYDVPNPSSGGTDFLGILGDASGGGGSTLIDRIQIRPQITLIDGGSIETGTITTGSLAANAVTAAKADIADLFAQNVTVEGSLSMGTNGEITNPSSDFTINKDGIKIYSGTGLANHLTFENGGGTRFLDIYGFLDPNLKQKTRIESDVDQLTIQNSTELRLQSPLITIGPSGTAINVDSPLEIINQDNGSSRGTLTVRNNGGVETLYFNGNPIS